MSMRSTALASLIGCVLLPACADQQESLIVQRAPAWTGEECVIDPSADAGLLFGVLDLDQGTPYLMPASLFNNLQTQSTSSSNAGIITNEIQITGAHVELDSDQAPRLISTLEDADSGYVSFEVTLASDSVLPGEAIGLGVEVISRATALEMKRIMDQFPDMFGADTDVTVIATVVFHGLRSGNKVGKIGQIDAREFSFPIRLCRGCLLDCTGCPEVTDDEGNVTAEEGVCPSDFMAGQFVGGICGNAQDFAIAPAGCEVGTP